MTTKGRIFALVTTCMAFAFSRHSVPTAQQPTVWDFQDLCWLPDGKAITFTGITEKKFRIYRINAIPGSKPVLLFPDVDVNQLSPTWSPDGKSVAFHLSREGQTGVYIANADGTGIRKLAENAITPSWSPNGQWIAYGSKYNGKYQIYVMDPDGKSQRLITTDGAASFNPSWSPDSRVIVFESDRDGDDKDELYRINADGSGEVLLKRDEANLVYPSFSADGRQIFYGAVANRNVDLFVMDADARGARLLRTHAGSAHASKEAGLLAFIGYDDNKLREVFIAKPDGSNAVAITSVNH
jgi:TolB protein